MHPHHAYPDVSWADLRTELQREIARRRAAFPAMVAKGRMLQAEADRELDILAAVLEDARRFEDPRQRRGAVHAWTWHERRAALTRELDYRARAYPQWIKKGQLTREDADRQTRRLACMRALYELGYDWRPANGTAPHFSALRPTPEEIDSRCEWHAIEVECRTRDGRTDDLEAYLAAVAIDHQPTAAALRAAYAKQEALAL